MSTNSHRPAERGAIVIQMAVCMLILLAFTAFVLDYGVMWASRGQAQTSADAGALAGAISLAFDSGTDFAGAKTKARNVALQNGVWGSQPDVQLADITFPPCPPGAPGLPDTCVKVDVFRNQRPGGSPLPMFFGNLVGVTNQGVRATATAQITAGDTVDCLKPWAVVDRWDEFAPGGAEPDYPNPDPDYLPTSTYDKYSDGKGNNPPQENDFYKPATQTDPGTGFSLPNDEGFRYAVKVGDGGSNLVTSGWFRAIRLPRLDGCNSGANCYSNNITSCNGLPSSFADPATVCPADIGIADEAYWAAKGCYRVETGNMVGPTAQGISDLIARDPGASYDAANKKIVGSTFSPATKSPRVVPIGVLNIDQYLAQDASGSNPVVRLENIYGFFIEGMGDVDPNTGAITCCSNGGKSVIGRIMTIPATGASRLNSSSSFLRSIILVR
jgi:putative Flp pilus-assembly TadE/G-like protein